MALLGSTELAARLVPALAALALVGVTAWLGAAIVSMDVAVLAALLLAVSPGLFALARYAILDTLFTALLFGGASLIAVAALRNRPGLQWGGYVLVGLAVLTKGPLAAVLCGLTLLVASAASAEARRRLFGLRLFAGLAIVAAISLPWYVDMWRRFPDEFVEGHLLNENIRLFARPMFTRQPGLWFYFRILAAGLLPWTGLLVGRLLDDVRRAIRRAPLDVFEILLWSWTIAVIGFFTFSRFKLDHYVFPAAPSLCLLCARAYADVRNAPADPLNSGARAGLHLVGPLLVAVGTGIGYFVFVRLELPCRQMETRLSDMIPLVRPVGLLRVVDFQFHGNRHVSFGLDNEQMSAGFDSALDVLFGVLLGSLGLHAGIPEVELVVVCEDVKLLVMQAHETTLTRSG